MFGRNRAMKLAVGAKAGSMKDAVADAADAVVEYVDPLAKDEKLRERLAAAIVAAAAARQRLRSQSGVTGLARRLTTDPVLRMQLLEVGAQLQAAQKRAKRSRSHRLRTTMVVVVGGAAVAAVAMPPVREKLTSLVRGRDDWAPGGWADGSRPAQTTIEEEVEVGVSVTTAYNQWTQFEEFPQFMEGVDEVRQLDDTLLHWAATVAGRHAEWDAKIVEQEPDRRIVWESTDGRRTRGTVSFEEAGPGRSRVKLRMAYTPGGVAEKVGSSVGLDNRRVRGDLDRFRQLVESRQVESGAWRGEIQDGEQKTT